MSDKFSVERRRSRETRRPDIVLFVNGIPLVVIECKRPDLDKGGDKAVTEAITQMIRNQKDDEIPGLFVFPTITGSQQKRCALWYNRHTKEILGGMVRRAKYEAKVHELINQPMSAAKKNQLYNHRDQAQAIRYYFDELELAGERLPTIQDHTMYSLLRQERLLELTYQFIVYDAGIKKIARYQQYFAVKATIQRGEELNVQGKRTGGVIWHTTGSGK